MRVGAAQADSTIDNALSKAAQFGLSKDAARREAAKVARVCAGWREHFAQTGVSARDIDYLAAFIDREFLKAQRDALVRRR